MLRILLTLLCGATFYLQVKFPHLTFHCNALTFITNLIWIYAF